MKLRIWVQIVLSIAILGGGFMGFKRLSAKRQSAKKKPPEAVVTPVETALVESQDGRITIYGLGTLKPSQSLSLQTQVVGPLEELSENLVAGGRIAAGEVLFKVDDRDYRLNVAQRKSQLTAARSQLKQEQGRQAVAKKEWALMGSKVKSSAAGRALALREPQVKAARAAIQSAQSAVSISNLALERTVVKAPFDAVVQSENVEVGQRVGPGQPLAQLVGTETWWAEISLPMNQLSRIPIPGAKAIIKQDPNGPGRVGKVLRRLPKIDPGSQMAKLIIEVPEPLSDADGPALFLNAGVEIAIEGRAFDNVVKIPRRLLRSSDSVWSISKENTLESLTVDVVWRQRDHVLVRGLEPGTELITSRIANAAMGQGVRRVGEPSPLPNDPVAEPIVDGTSTTQRIEREVSELGQPGSKEKQAQ